MSDQMSDHSKDGKDRKVNTTDRHPGKTAQHLPHERDESVGAHKATPRDDMKQAASDLAAGQVDTDLRGTPGVEKVVPASAGTAAQVPASRPK